MFDIQEELKKLPDKPGVYLMKDETGNVIYVGKARVLKNRVRQYFQTSAAHTPKVIAMVAKIKEFEYIVTDTELEALILECNLIKDKKPRYNILLKDDKSYPYIKITMNELYPRIFMTRRVEKDGARYFGPYSNVISVRETIDLMKKVFPIRTCKRVLPRDIGKSRPCLNYHIGQCLGPCSGKVQADEYRAVVRDICSFLDGKQDMIIDRIEKQMQEAADKLEFERAAVLRNKLTGLRHITQEQKVLSVAGMDQDIIGFAADKTDTCVQIFFIRGGKLLGREFYIIEGTGEAELQETAPSFLKQFYGTADIIPSEIIIAVDFEDKDLVEDWLSSRRGARVHVKVPQRGEKLHMVEMVSENARIELKRFTEKASQPDGVQEGLREMAGLLGLNEIPRRIEAYDISNTGSSEIVASMVVFEDGRAAKKEYRRFKVRSAEIQNDYASMQEVLYRRFKHAEAERQRGSEVAEEIEKTEEIEKAGKIEDTEEILMSGESVDSGEIEKAGEIEKVGEIEKTEEINASGEVEITSGPEIAQKDAGGEKKFSKLPDLIMLDGGLGHVNAVGKVFDELGVTVPLCGMVKDDKHRTRGLVLPDREIDLTSNLNVLRFVTSIQDEAHRFALDYNKKLRAKRYSKSILDEAEGIGPKRKKALLKHFGSVSRMRQAGVDDLEAVEGISRPLAEKLYEFFRSIR